MRERHARPRSPPSATWARSSSCSRCRTTRRCALYCDSVLGPLENGEGEYGGELLRSLEAFLEQNGQWEKAARELYCHRHTLRYRIRRVEELTGRDLGQRARPDRVLARAAGAGAGRDERAAASSPVAVLGAGGTIAPGVVRDLAESEEVAALRLLDLDGERAAAVADRPRRRQGAGRARSTPRSGLRARARGLRRARQLRQLPRQPRRDARLPEAGCHYIDLGGLYWMTDRQLELHDEFERAGLLALLGMGSSPGKTNVMARARGARARRRPSEST